MYEKSAAPYLEVLAVEPLYPANGTERKGEAIAARATAVSLPGKGSRGRDAGGLREARRSGGETNKTLREMQFPSVMPSSIVSFISLRYVGRRYSKLSIDLDERVLGGGEAELPLEQRCFGGVSVGAGQIETLCRVNELLGLLNDAREVGKHGVSLVSGA